MHGGSKSVAASGRGGGMGGIFPLSEVLPPTCPPIRRKNGQNQPFLANSWIKKNGQNQPFLVFPPLESHYVPSIPSTKKFLVPPLVKIINEPYKKISILENNSSSNCWTILVPLLGVPAEGLTKSRLCILIWELIDAKSFQFYYYKSYMTHNDNMPCFMF